MVVSQQIQGKFYSSFPLRGKILILIRKILHIRSHCIVFITSERKFFFCESCMFLVCLCIECMYALISINVFSNNSLKLQQIFHKD